MAQQRQSQPTVPMRTPNRNNVSEDIFERTALLLFASMLSMVESFLPRIPLFPWLKPGLANCITIVWIVRYGMVDAILFSLIRIWLVVFFFGFSFPGLSLSISGAVAAGVSMGSAWYFVARRGLLGAVGVGIIGAIFHNAAQLGAAYLLLVRNILLFYQIPLMLIASVIFGTITGIAAVFVLRLIVHSCNNDGTKAITSFSTERPAEGGQKFLIGPSNNFLFGQSPNLFLSDVIATHKDIWRFIGAVVILLFCALLACTENWLIIASCAATTTLAAQIAERGSLSALFNPLQRFWLLFVSVSVFHLFFSYGKRIVFFPLLTVEGVSEAIIQCLRLWSWLQLAPLMSRFQFDRLFFNVLQRIFVRHGLTLSAGLLAMQQLPSAIGRFPTVFGRQWRFAVFHPIRWIISSMQQWYAQAVEVSRGQC